MTPKTSSLALIPFSIHRRGGLPAWVMKFTLLLSLTLMLSVGGVAAQAGATQGRDFQVGKGSFLLDGQPYVIRAGEIHFPRIPCEYWEHRIQMTKAMGMNAICVYVFWNYHEQEEGVFDFSGDKDLAAFVRLAQKNGLYCIVRPGPYACAEWDMGGLPWWLLKQEKITVRNRGDAYFMERAKRFLTEVGRQLAPLQIQNGGNIILVQVENEYGVWGRDALYMGEIRDTLRQAGFDKVPLFRCDWSSNFDRYDVPGVAATLNFGAGANIEQQFSKFKQVYPEAPLMCSEYWTGWFDHWGRPHETKAINSFIGSMKDMLSVSLYMAHGGTSFGQWGGANSPPYSCMATSYDYNAPINEAGQPTDKFFAVRDLLKNYLQPGETLAPIPANQPEVVIPAFALTETAPLFDNLPEAKTSVKIQPMELFNQGWGRILYRTTLPATATPARLKITDVHDWAVVYVNGKQVAELDRRKQEDTVQLPASDQPAQIDILVEATGRVNFGQAIIDRKGITEKVELITAAATVSLENWQVYNFPVDYAFQAKRAFTATPATAAVEGPAWHRGRFNLKQTGDTYLEMSRFGKGMVWVNGHNLGRFWKIGPQQTLYVPGCWLKIGDNEVIVLDLLPVAPGTTLAGLAQPILDQIIRDESLLYRKKGQQLDLSGETPVLTGSFTGGPGWLEVPLPAVSTGRYLCLTALNAQTPSQKRAAVSELEVVDEAGKVVPRGQWKILYADSEEIVAGNHSAEKTLDLQETTYWETEWVKTAAGHPHHLIIDLGQDVKIKTLRYLGPWAKKNDSTIKDFHLYLKTTPFKY